MVKPKREPKLLSKRLRSTRWGPVLGLLRNIQVELPNCKIYIYGPCVCGNVIGFARFEFQGKMRWMNGEFYWNFLTTQFQTDNVEVVPAKLHSLDITLPVVKYLKSM